MSFPLDRLYNYFRDIVKCDILIYRWQPHGSKKLEDLELLELEDKYHYEPGKESWYRAWMTPSLICHDQEPLMYDYYTPEMIDEFYDVRYIKSRFYKSARFKSIVSTLNIRAAMTTSMSIYDNVLLCHSEKNSENLEKYLANGFTGVYYWSHALIARDWFRYAEHDPMLDHTQKSVKRDFLVYNRAWTGTREYRLKFVDLLLEHNLTDHCQISFNPMDHDQHYTQHQYANPKFCVARTDIETVLPANTATSNFSADYNGADYAHTAIEVVLETLFDDQRNHLTEKSLRPIACGQPFLLVATAGSLQYLRDYGFKTFSPLIDESYDLIVDPMQRLEAVVKEIKRISSLSEDEKASLYAQLNDIAVYNKELFFSKAWQDSIVNELVTNLQQGLVELENHKTGRLWKAIYDPELADDLIRNCEKTPFYHYMNQLLGLSQ